MQIKYSDQTALVVEHNQDTIALLKSLLNALGVKRVYIAPSVNMALSLMRGMAFDVCIAGYDLGKDEKVGLQLLQEARAEGVFSYQGVFVLAIDPDRAGLLKSALEYAPDTYLAYPVDAVKLRGRLDKLLRVKLVTRQIEALRDDGEFSKAIRVCDLLSDKYPGLQVYVQRLKGMVLLQAQRVDEARDVFELLLRRPNLGWAKVGLGIALYQQGHYKQAQQLLQQVIDSQQMGVEVFDWATRAQIAQGLTNQASALLRKAVMLQPTVALLQKRLAEVSSQNQQWRLSVEAYRQALKYSRYSVFQSPDIYLGLVSAIAQNFEGQDVQKWRETELDILHITEGLLQDYEGDENLSLWVKLVLAESFREANATEKATLRATDAYSAFVALDKDHQCLWLSKMLNVLAESVYFPKLRQLEAQLQLADKADLPVWYTLRMQGIEADRKGDSKQAYVLLRAAHKEAPPHGDLTLLLVSAGLDLLKTDVAYTSKVLFECEQLLLKLTYSALDTVQKKEYLSLLTRCVSYH